MEMRIPRKYVSYVAGVTVLTTLLFGYYYAFNSFATGVREREATHNAEIYLETMTIIRQYYSDMIVPRGQSLGVRFSHDYRVDPKTLPVPATLAKEIGNRISSKNNDYQYSFYSRYPFRSSIDNKPLTDFRARALEYFETKQGSQYREFSDRQGVKTIQFAKPVYMRETCVECHNSHPQSVKTDWRVGDLRGVSSLSLPMENATVWSDPELRSPLFLLLVATVFTIGLFVSAARTRAARRHLNQVISQNSQLSEAREKITELAYTDELSGLANRREFARRLEEAKRGLKSGSEAGFSIVLIDLSKFKAINDLHGHAVGDELIVAIGRRIRSVLSEQCLAARMGGDEFAIFIPNLFNLDDARKVAERLVAQITPPLTCVVSGAQLKLKVGCNIGIRVCPPGDERVDTALADADLAMYFAKSAGVFICSYDEEMRAAHDKEKMLEANLDRSLSDDDFQLAFQTINDLETGKIVRLEALLRWDNMDGRYAKPDSFLPTIMRMGREAELDYLVIRKAAMAANYLFNAMESSELRVNVNVLANTFNDEMFPDKLKAILAELGCSGSRLGIELTEHALISDFDLIEANIRKVRELGCSIALDDFGTGFSALSYLNRLDIDQLKIDKSFINDTSSADKSHSLIRALVSLANDLNVELVAEGIESRQQQSALRDLGVKLGQGYLFSMPRPLSLVAKKLMSNQQFERQLDIA